MITATRCNDAFVARYGYTHDVSALTVWDIIENVERTAPDETVALDRIMRMMATITDIKDEIQVMAEAYYA